MEELYCDHIGGGLLMILKGTEAEVTDRVSGVSKIVEFENSGKAMVFIGEYLINLDEPTKEFKNLLPEFC